MSSKKNRPVLKLKLTTTDKITEGLGWIALIGIWVLTFYGYGTLPETIPIHYNASGEADGFGDKINIIVLPIISTVLFLGLTLLNKYAHLMNYSTKITEENAKQQYTNMTRLMRFLKLAIVLTFGFIVFKTIQNASGNTSGLGTWFLPFFLGMMLIPVVFFVIKSAQTNKN